jgi:hypothetical protein
MTGNVRERVAQGHVRGKKNAIQQQAYGESRPDKAPEFALNH